jgi:hypothetical protein
MLIRNTLGERKSMQRSKQYSAATTELVIETAKIHQRTQALRLASSSIRSAAIKQCEMPNSKTIANQWQHASVVGNSHNSLFSCLCALQKFPHRL